MPISFFAAPHHLGLETEDRDGDADDCCDAQSEEHGFSVIVTKTKEQHTGLILRGKLGGLILQQRRFRLPLPGNGSSHVGQSQGLKNT